MKTENEIRDKIETVKELEISVRSVESFKLFAVTLLEWVLGRESSAGMEYFRKGKPTGCFDVSKVELREEDIVRLPSGKKATIRYLLGGFWFVGESENFKYSLSDTYLVEGCKIIGNTFEGEK